MDLNNPGVTHKLMFTQRQQVTSVTCVCRRMTGRHEKAGKIYLDPIGPTKNLAETRELYNNPDNHHAPFEEGDKIWLGQSLR